MDDASATDNCGEVSISVEEVTRLALVQTTRLLVRSQRQTTVVMLLQLLRRSRLLIRLLQYLRSQGLQRSVLTNTQWMKHQLQTTVERCISVEEATTPGACAETIRLLVRSQRQTTVVTLLQLLRRLRLLIQQYLSSLSSGLTAECSDEYTMDDASATDNVER